MMATDRDALLCDLAETYGVFQMQGLPVSTLATLAVGLRENSRIKMRLRGAKAGMDSVLLASIVDRLTLLLWRGTERRDRPELLAHQLVGTQRAEESDLVVYDSPEAYWEARRNMMGGGRNGHESG